MIGTVTEALIDLLDDTSLAITFYDSIRAVHPQVNGKTVAVFIDKMEWTIPEPPIFEMLFSADNPVMPMMLPRARTVYLTNLKLLRPHLFTNLFIGYDPQEDRLFINKVVR